MAFETSSLVTVGQLQAAMSKTKNVFDSKISMVFKPKGTVTFADLTQNDNEKLVAANLGNVYNISDAFTTTAAFVEGAGKSHTAGSNVAIVEATAATYKLTEDSTAASGKTYFVDNSGTPVFPAPEVGDDISSSSYYEIDDAATYKFDVMPGDTSNFQTLAIPTAANNIALLDANGQVTDSTITVATDSEVNEMLNGVFAQFLYGGVRSSISIFIMAFNKNSLTTVGQLNFLAEIIKRLDSVFAERINVQITTSTDSDADYAAEVADARVDTWANSHSSLGDNIRTGQFRLENLYLDIYLSLQSQIQSLAESSLKTSLMYSELKESLRKE